MPKKSVEKVLGDLGKAGNSLKKMLAITTGNAAGWDVKVPDPSLVHDSNITVYLYDLPTKKTFHASIPVQSFFEIADKGFNLDDQGKQEARSSLVGAAISFSDEEKIPEVDGKDADSIIPFLISLYIGGTKTYQSALEQRSKMPDAPIAFFVMVYRKKKGKEGKLRPFSLFNQKGIMSTDDFFSAVNQVIEYDSIRNPEWLK